jgi:hypothetical protein
VFTVGYQLASIGHGFASLAGSAPASSLGLHFFPTISPRASHLVRPFSASLLHADAPSIAASFLSCPFLRLTPTEATAGVRLLTVAAAAVSESVGPSCLLAGCISFALGSSLSSSLALPGVSPLSSPLLLSSCSNLPCQPCFGPFGSLFDMKFILRLTIEPINVF